MEAIVQAALLDFTEVVKTYVEDVSKADKSTAADSTAADSTAADSTATDESDPLVKRLKVLEQKLADAEKAEQDRQAENARLRFEAELNKAIASHNPEYLDQVQSILSSRLKDAKETEAGWVVGSSGKTISEAVTEFFATPFGKHLLPPETAGAGTKKPSKQPPQQSSDSSAIVSAFL